MIRIILMGMTILVAGCSQALTGQLGGLTDITKWPVPIYYVGPDGITQAGHLGFIVLPAPAPVAVQTTK